MELLHWNGLPPAGPRMAVVGVHALHGEAAPVGEAEHEDSFQAPLAGEIEGVVQAVQEDKQARPDECGSWRYEVVLAVADPTQSIYGEGKPHTAEDIASAQTFEQGEAPSGGWRCAKCYRSRFETMCFGMNDAGSSSCQHCDAPMAECGWSVTLPFEELPAHWQHSMERRHGPKITAILRTKWPGCVVHFDAEPAPSV